MMSEEKPEPRSVDLLHLMVHMCDISLKVRILREWQQASRARAPVYGEREVLILELIEHFSPVTEGELRSVFGLSPSSMNDAVKGLVDSGLLDKTARDESDQRLRPLTLLAKGKAALKAIRESAAARYWYLLSELGAEQLAALRPVLKDIDKAATREIRRRVFDEYT